MDIAGSRHLNADIDIQSAAFCQANIESAKQVELDDLPSIHTACSIETQYSWEDKVHKGSAEAGTKDYGLQQWVYEISDAKITLAERLERAKWFGMKVHRMKL